LQGVFPPPLFFTFQPHVVQAAVARQCEQPRLKRSARSLVVVRFAPELEKNILDDLFGRGGLLCNSQGQGINSSRVAVIENFKRLRGPAGKLLHQRSEERRVGKEGGTRGA